MLSVMGGSGGMPRVMGGSGVAGAPDPPGGDLVPQLLVILCGEYEW